MSLLSTFSTSQLSFVWFSWRHPQGESRSNLLFLLQLPQSLQSRSWWLSLCLQCFMFNAAGPSIKVKRTVRAEGRPEVQRVRASWQLGGGVETRWVSTFCTSVRSTTERLFWLPASVFSRCGQMTGNLFIKGNVSMWGKFRPTWMNRLERIQV